MQPAKRLGQKRRHALRDVILLEKVSRLDFVRREMGQVEHRVATSDVKHAVARDAEFFEGLHFWIIDSERN